MSDFLDALRFLTIVPLGRGGGGETVEPERMASSMAYFPLVGAWLGVFLWLLDFSLGKILPHLVVAVLLVGFLALITGGLHLDGLADTLDGIFGGRGDRERALAIMKDSRVGAMGVVGLALLLLLKFTCIDALHGLARGQALIVMPMLARFSQVQLAYRSEYARKEGSLARPFVEFLELRHFIAAAVGALLITYIAAGFRGLLPLAATLAFTLGARLYFHGKLGGVTGDTIGFVSEINEALVLVVFLAMM
jgi:adenosylcobinamide-GDP ribazoletransferase